MVFLDGVYVIGEEGLVFRRVRPPTRRSLEHVVQTVGQRVGAYLERQGLLVWDIKNSYLELESTDTSAMDDLLGRSISYRIAVGPHAGRKAFTLQTIPAREDGIEDGKLAKASWFSILRSVSGTSLVPKPRVNLTRFHGVFAPNSALRQQVTPARGGRQDNEPRTSAQRHAAMTWAQRLKRVLMIDNEMCYQCGSTTWPLAVSTWAVSNGGLCNFQPYRCCSYLCLLYRLSGPSLRYG